MSERLDGLEAALGKQPSDLAHAMSLAHLDQQTMMPPHGGEARLNPGDLYAHQPRDVRRRRDRAVAGGSRLRGYGALIPTTMTPG